MSSEHSQLIDNPFAGERALVQSDQDWIDSAQENLSRESSAFDFSDITGTDRAGAQAEAQAFFDQLKDTDQTLKDMKASRAKSDAYREVKTLVFASLSLDGQGLDDLLEAASQMPETAVVFRGLPDGMKFSEGIAWLQQMAAQYDPMPNIMLDPTLFRRHNIQSVPTIVMLDAPSSNDSAKRAEVARVAGLTDPHWLAERVERGQGGDLGNKGPLAPVEERDLIEVMQERVMAIDWEAKKEQAIERFWSNQNFLWLPTANQPRTRRIDPRVYVTEDITDAEGQVLVAQGTYINPLDLRPFTQAVVVFDPLDRKQVELLDEMLPEIAKREGVQSTTLIATQFDSLDGWDSYRSVTDHFEAPVYLLTPDIVQRFEIERLPSVITSDGKAFVVEELTKGSRP
ncbi:glycyl-tRNA synthetase beta chain [Modicisalibacter xianhensis]|uniref:Glycyl-tRNA synthetase beta chain n=1 Tax=Modicisalibacter xianhensis TaxID=442341 RepID=A0A4R8FRR7_9GAMM|nr:glycyl-tRNA synthetase beta chain [Halomonas xianhensis]